MAYRRWTDYNEQKLSKNLGAMGVKSLSLGNYARFCIECKYST